MAALKADEKCLVVNLAVNNAAGHNPGALTAVGSPILCFFTSAKLPSFVLMGSTTFN